MKLGCPGCKAVFSAPDNAAGRSGKCPKCGMRLSVPAALPVSKAAPPTLPDRATINEVAPRPSLIQKFLNEDQDSGAVETALERVEQILTTGESILYVAVQAKPVLTIAPDCVVLTSKRFIVYRAKLLGRFDFDDYIWRDLKDARLTEGMLGATILLTTIEGKTISIDYLPKKQARVIYRFSQEMEEQAREDRRDRRMEESRAAANGVYVQNVTSPTDGQPDPLGQLRQLKGMLDAGLISQAEYDTKKTEILARM